MSQLLKTNVAPLKFSERRVNQRIQTRIDARFLYGSRFYPATVLNLSEKGMFINTTQCIPAESMFVIIIRLEGELMKVIVKVKRNVKNNLACDGLGIELLSPSASYLDYVNKLRELV